MAGRSTFRLSPLAGTSAGDHLDERGLGRVSAKSLVMRLDLDNEAGRRRDGPDPAEGHRPLRRLPRSQCAMHGPGAAAGLVGDHRRDRAGGRAVRARGAATSRWPPRSACMTAISPACSRSRPHAAERGKGHGRRLRAVGAEMGAAARRAAGLAAGRGRQSSRRWRLYERSASSELYRYHYRQPPEA